MTIKLNEIYKLTEKMDDDAADKFIASIEESDEYNEMLDDIMLDFKHVVSEWLREAISVGFDREILSIDYGVDTDTIDTLKEWENHNLDVEIDNF